MEKIQRDIEQLEKESKGTNEWKTAQENLLMALKKSFEKYAEVVEGINQYQTALKETIAMLSIKMEKHITSADSFKAQVVKHQVASKTEFEAFGKKLTKNQNNCAATAVRLRCKCSVTVQCLQ